MSDNEKIVVTIDQDQAQPDANARLGTEVEEVAELSQAELEQVTGGTIVLEEVTGGSKKIIAI